MPHWIIILKTIRLGLKKGFMIRNLRHLFYVLNFKFVVFCMMILLFEFLYITSLFLQ